MSQFLEKQISRLQNALNKPGVINDVLTTAENNLGVNRIYIAPGVLGFLAVYLVFGIGAQFICNLIGFAYPAYASIKAIESRNKEDDTKWLTYWVVYGCFTIVEFFSDILLSWFPLYWLGKCVFLIVCFAPIKTNGSKLIYQNIIRPIFLNYEAEIDSTMDELVNRTTRAASEFKPRLSAPIQPNKTLEEVLNEQFY